MGYEGKSSTSSKGHKNSDSCDIANYNLMQNNNNKYGKCELIDFRVDLGSLKVHLLRSPQIADRSDQQVVPSKERRRRRRDGSKSHPQRQKLHYSPFH